MSRTTLLLLAVAAATLWSPTLHAEVAAPAPAAATVTSPSSAVPPAVAQAADAWRKAVDRVPKLVSLAAQDTSGGHDKVLKGRLQVLGDKTFSNREWKDYWATQAKTAGALAKAVEAAGASPVWTKGLRDWEALAKDKSSNQDAYLKAIERERDALEERLESMIEPDEKKPETTSSPASTEEPTPYARRKQHLDDLGRRIELQTGKRNQAKSDLKLINDQLESQRILLSALKKDVTLAKREREVASANEGARPAPPWADVWRRLAAKARPKVTALSQEARFEAARERGRKVEAGLTRSQIKFRDERIGQLQARLERDSGVASWIEATRDTLINWVLNRAWRILIGLAVVLIGLRIALRLVRQTAARWVAKAEGDPDDPTDDDQRALTLATVFSGVARIALYVIAALLALEQIGIDTGPLLGSVAILGLAVSFGSQNLVRDVVNGFFILLENQYAVGEVVEISGKTGTVEQITIRSTWVRQFNGDLHVVPNGSITTVTNMTREWSRTVVDVGVGYGADLAKVQAVCERVAEEMAADEAWSERLLETPVWGGVASLGDSSVNVRMWVQTRAGDQWAVGRELNRRFKLAFDEAGIEIPFPQRVVWTKSE